MSDDGVMSYFAKIGLDASEFLDGMSKSSGGILQFYRDVTLSMSATMIIFDKVMAYGQEFINLSNQASEFVSTLDKLSITTGMSVEELQRFSNVARYADSDISTLAMSINRMQLNLSSQGEEGDKVRKMLDDMGVSYKNADGSLKSSAEIFPEIIEGLKGLGSSSERVTAANAIFGRSYQSLAGYLNMSKSEMQEYFDSANVLTDAQTQKLRDYERATKDLNAASATLARTAGGDVAPGLTSVYEALTDIETGLSTDTPLVDTLNDSLHTLADLLGDIATNMQILWISASAFDKGELFTSETYDKIEKIALKNDAAKAKRDWNYETSGTDLSQSGSGILDPFGILSGKKSGSSLTYKDNTAEKAAATAEKERVSALVSAYKEYEDAINKVTDAQKKRYEQAQDFYTDIQNTDNAESAETLINTYRKQLRDSNTDVSKDTSAVTAAATEFNQIKSGTPLENIKGTDQYTEAQAKNTLELTVNIEGVGALKISKQIDKNTPNNYTLTQADLIQAGVRPK
jgi:hypothetical protein